jgi:hypothetical protein
MFSGGGGGGIWQVQRQSAVHMSPPPPGGWPRQAGPGQEAAPAPGGLLSPKTRPVVSGQAAMQASSAPAGNGHDMISRPFGAHLAALH